MTNTIYAIPTTQRPSKKNTYTPIESDIYLCRLVRAVSLGIQAQPDYQGQPKNPAFKVALSFELLGEVAEGTNAEGLPLDPQPACVFLDVFVFPGATRGKAFDVVNAIDPSLGATPSDLEWFKRSLGSVVSVQVGSYINKDGVTKNTVKAVLPTSNRAAAKADEALCDLIWFNCYEDSDEMNSIYHNDLYKFQTKLLMDADDNSSIPFAGVEQIKNTNPITTQIKPTVEDYSTEVPF